MLHLMRPRQRVALHLMRPRQRVALHLMTAIEPITEPLLLLNNALKMDNAQRNIHIVNRPEA
jgi:hypothetical protein